MHRTILIAAGCLLLTATAVSAQENPAQSATDVAKSHEAIRRGLTFLREDAKKWRTDRQCSTCHHGLFTVWAMTEARHRGWDVDLQDQADIVQWLKERMDKIDQPRDTRPGWRNVNTISMNLALMARSVPGQDVISTEELAKIRGHLVRHQEVGGEWAWSSAPPNNRPPPFFESDEVATLLALLAMPNADEPMPDDVRDSRQKGIDWLTKADVTDTTQAAALRLLWKARSNPAAGIQPDVDRFLRRQRVDGGFGQLADRPSDAYATGQAIYILNLIGVSPDRDEICRAVSFLVSTQNSDGSWPMTRRGHPGVEPSAFTVPITYFGSGWGTLGLLRTVPK